MSKQITLTIPDAIYSRAQQLARSNRRDVADILAESISLEVKQESHSHLSAIDLTIERESSAFLKMHSDLLSKCVGEYVAIYQGELVDSDFDFAILYARIEQKYPDSFFLIRQVADKPEPIYHFRSPRFAEE